MPDRNLFGKWQDLVAGPVNQPSNIDLLRALFQSRQPQVPPYMPPMNNIQAPERGKYVNMLELSGVPMPNGQARPPIPQEFLNMPTDTAVEAYRNQLYPQSNAQSVIEPQMDMQRNQTLQTPQVLAQQPTDNTNRNNMLMAALFGGVAPALAAAFGGQTGLAAGSGFAQGFGGQYAKQKELEQKYAMEAPQKVLEQEYKQSQINLNKKYEEYLGGAGGQPTAGSDISSLIPEGENPDDYILEPTITKVKGIPQQTFLAKRKDKVPPAQMKEVADIDTNLKDIKANIEMLEDNPKIKEFLGPGLIQRPGAMADIMTQIGLAPKDFATFKASSDLAFQKYRKWVTGVQAGYPELQWIVVDYPKPTDRADIYISKAIRSIEGMERNKQTFLDYLSANNYAVGKLRQVGAQSKIRMTSPDGTAWELDQSEVEEAKKHGWK